MSHGPSTRARGCTSTAEATSPSRTYGLLLKLRRPEIYAVSWRQPRALTHETAGDTPTCGATATVSSPCARPRRREPVNETSALTLKTAKSSCRLRQRLLLLAASEPRRRAARVADVNHPNMPWDGTELLVCDLEPKDYPRTSRGSLAAGMSRSFSLSGHRTGRSTSSRTARAGGTCTASAREASSRSRRRRRSSACPNGLLGWPPTPSSRPGE